MAIMSEPTPWIILFLRRKAAGLTRAGLAEKTGYSVSYIGQLEYGLRTNPTKPVLIALANALGCAPADLVNDEPSQDVVDLVTLDILAAQHAELAAQHAELEDAIGQLRHRLTGAAA